jgi:hypothetical protein
MSAELFVTPFHLFLFAWLVLTVTSTVAALYGLFVLAPTTTLSVQRRTVIIAPVRGGGPLLEDFFRRLRSQTYTAGRIIVIVESEVDSAYEIARSCEPGPGLPMSTLIAGRSATDTGQKVWSLLTALGTLNGGDEIVVFIDADTLPNEDWSRRLVLPIVQRRAEVVSGYRWLLPHGDRWGAYWAAASNNSIASIPRARFWNLAWGGSVAIKRELLDRIQIAAWWKGAISDDLQLTRALWSHGIRIVRPPGLVVPTPIGCDARQAFEFGRRQYVLIRTHLLFYWALSATLVLVPLALTMLALGQAIRGDATAIAVLSIVFALSQARTFLRARANSWMLRNGALSKFRPSKVRLWAAALICPLFHALCIVGALSSRRIQWSGIGYHIYAPQRTRRL